MRQQRFNLSKASCLGQFCKDMPQVTVRLDPISLGRSCRTPKENGLEHYGYLRRVFTDLPAASSLEEIEALLPWSANKQDGVC